jgi:c-src tyrosine kinase
LQHPNLVQLIGVVTTGSPIMIVCELCGKGGLLQYLTTRGRSKISSADQLKFTKDICAGMCYLESHSVVHRCGPCLLKRGWRNRGFTMISVFCSDLACRNILLADDITAKVADFGLAKDSVTGQVDVGKLPIKWTAPEALRQKVL